LVTILSVNTCAKRQPPTSARCDEEQKKIVTNRRACWSSPAEAKNSSRK
jgi:hypothetical protein